MNRSYYIISKGIGVLVESFDPSLVNFIDFLLSRFKVDGLNEKEVLNIKLVPREVGHKIIPKEGSYMLREGLVFDPISKRLFYSPYSDFKDIISGKNIWFSISGDPFHGKSLPVSLIVNYPMMLSNNIKLSLSILKHRLFYADTRAIEYVHTFSYLNELVFRLLILLLRLFGIIAIHASSVSINGKAVLLYGGSGSGKTSLSLWLCSNGFDFLSDDVTLIDKGTAIGFYRSVKVEDFKGSLHNIRHLTMLEKLMILLSSKLLKRQISLETDVSDVLPQVKVVNSAHPSLTIGIFRSKCNKIKLEEITASKAIDYIIHSSIDNFYFAFFDSITSMLSGYANVMGISLNDIFTDWHIKAYNILSNYFSSLKHFIIKVPSQEKSRTSIFNEILDIIKHEINYH
jgi:hypothetical protein